MELARHWRLNDQRYKLVGNICNSCGTKFFPPRQVCTECHGTEFSEHTFQGTGEIYSFSTLHQAPLGYEGQVPYTVALVKLDEGPLVTAQITDANPEELKVGTRVEMVTRKLREQGEEGLIIYGYKFRPVMNGK
jgi:uncharacterized OB-fold protein